MRVDHAGAADVVDAVLGGDALDGSGGCFEYGCDQDTVSVHVSLGLVLATATQAEPEVAMGADILGQICNPIYLLSSI